jgi:hypothetical protein
LSALLSQAFVAFTIEFDNEFERRVPHRTTNYGSTPGFSRAPWLVSMAMWTRYMQHVPVEGIPLGELQARLEISNKGLHTWLTRLGKWWGHLEVQPALPTSPSKRLPLEAMIRPTAGGRTAIEVWRTLTPLVENRWRERFGNGTVNALERALRELADQLDPALPNFFSILEYEKVKANPRKAESAGSQATLPQLLVRVLLAFAFEFDRQSIAPRESCANVLRVAGDEGTRVLDLPRLTYLSSDGVAAALRELTRNRCGTVKAGPGSRTKILFLTPRGRMARDVYPELTQKVEEGWQKRFGSSTLGSLRTSLEELSDSEQSGAAPLLRGLVPRPDGWRPSPPPIEGLPHFPMVTHRGGFPDGS